jgi:hypothetical protein
MSGSNALFAAATPIGYECGAIGRLSPWLSRFAVTFSQPILKET